MKKSELRRLIREEIDKINSTNLITEGDVTFSIRWDAKLYAKLPSKMRRFLDKFPNDAIGWRHATDEVADVARTVLQYYSEFELDVDSDSPKYVYTNARRKLKSPSDWNTFYKSVIAMYYNKLSAYAKEHFHQYYSHWF